MATVGHVATPLAGRIRVAEDTRVATDDLPGPHGLGEGGGGGGPGEASIMTMSAPASMAFTAAAAWVYPAAEMAPASRSSVRATPLKPRVLRSR